jgi:hypothetical protein
MKVCGLSQDPRLTDFDLNPKNSVLNPLSDDMKGRFCKDFIKICENRLRQIESRILSIVKIYQNLVKICFIRL